MPTTDAFDPYHDLSSDQRTQLETYEDLLRRYNETLNLISPDTTDAITERHILHSLVLRVRDFPAGARIVDWGSGGGLPAIPLAIAYPDTEVIAVDSVGKKMRAVRSMARRLGLDNLFAWAGRAENWPDTAHYSVSRATAPLVDLWSWHTRMATINGVTPAATDWPLGLIALKGGDLSDEIGTLQTAYPNTCVQQIPLRPLLDDAYPHAAHFVDKCMIVVTNDA